jgi:hypothetical protein
MPPRTTANRTGRSELRAGGEKQVVVVVVQQPLSSGDNDDDDDDDVDGDASIWRQSSLVEC